MTVILVTGGCGFIGSNFINYWLAKYEHDAIWNLDKLLPCARTELITLSAPRYNLVVGDICDASLVFHLLELHNVEVVVHFAAQSHVDHSFSNSMDFTKDNVLGTHTLLECVRTYGKIRKFLHMSTDEVYGEVHDEHPGCIEESILMPTNPYAASKAAAEFYCRTYNTCFGLPITITRCNNVYGPRQFPEKLIPKFCMAMQANRQCEVHGQGKTKRAFIYVDDVCSAIEVILQRGIIGQTYNIGCTDEYSVMEVSQKLLDIISPECTLKNCTNFVRDREFNDRRYAVSVEKLTLLGWTGATTKFDDGLRRTIAWYNKNRALYDTVRPYKPQYDVVFVVTATESPLYNLQKSFWLQNLAQVETFVQQKVRIVFLYNRESQKLPVERRGDYDVCVKAPEALEHVLYGTYEALRYVRSAFDFRYIIRTTLSTLFMFDRVLTTLESVPRTTFLAGVCGEYKGNPFVSGAGIFASKDVVELLLNTTPQPEEIALPDDVAISNILKRAGCKITQSVPRFDIVHRSARQLREELPYIDAVLEKRRDICQIRIKNSNNCDGDEREVVDAIAWNHLLMHNSARREPQNVKLR